MLSNATQDKEIITKELTQMSENIITGTVIRLYIYAYLLSYLVYTQTLGRIVIHVNILLGTCIGVRGVVVPTVAINPKDVGSRPSNGIFFLMFFFSLLLLQCDFNINLMPYLGLFYSL